MIALRYPRIFDHAHNGSAKAVDAVTSGSPPQGIVILLNRAFSGSGFLKDKILSSTSARGRLYKDWMTPLTPVRVEFVEEAETPAVYMATGLVQFRKMVGDAASLDRIEVASFKATEGVCGVVLSHWKSGAA